MLKKGVFLIEFVVFLQIRHKYNHRTLQLEKEFWRSRGQPPAQRRPIKAGSSGGLVQLAFQVPPMTQILQFIQEKRCWTILKVKNMLSYQL